MQDKEEEKQVSTEFTPSLQDDNEDKMHAMLFCYATLCCFVLTGQVYSQKGLLCRYSHEVLTKMAARAVARGKTSSSCIILFPVYLKRRISANISF